MGRLVADPELRQTQSGTPVCRFRIAIDRPYQKDRERQADFIGCTAWKNTAEFVARYFSKGKMIIVEGSLRNNDYTDNNGVKHYSMDVLANNVAFGESKGSGENNPQQYSNEYAKAGTPKFDTVPAPQNNPYAQQPQLKVDDLGEFEEILSDGDCPF